MDTSQIKPVPIQELLKLVLIFLKSSFDKTLEGFYTISGIDGSGQNTQCTRLAYYFSKRGQDGWEDCWVTGQPREIGKGAEIRAILRHQVSEDPGEFAVQMMMAEDRAEHMGEIMGELWNNRRVVCARYLDDNAIYSRARGLDETEIADVLAANSEFPRPKVAIYLDLPVEEAMRRIRKRSEETGKPLERFETPECLMLVKEGFLALAKVLPNVHVVDATGTEDEVHQRIVAVIEQFG